MKMTISKKLYIGIGVLAVVLIGLAVFSQVSIQKTKSELVLLKEYPELQAMLGARIIDHYKWAEGLGVGTLLLGKEFTGQLDHTRCGLGEWYYSFKPPKELEDEFKKIEEPHKRFHATASKILTLLKEGRRNEAIKVYQEETMSALAATQEALTEMRIGVNKLINKKIASIESMQKSIGMVSLFVYTGIILAIIIGSIVFIVKPIKNGFGSISDWVNTISTGDLSRHVEIKSNDEIGDMAANLNEMVRKIKNVITKTLEASNQVSAAADQIAQANQNLSQSITEQAASVEETSSTMEEMSASIRQTADNAKEANKLAQSAKASAETGITVMGDTISAMDEINKSSSKIANISNVIEEIAFQTNLLALNAAVEAARAGEHGKGFAVVASEIRNLAQRTSQSAKEITDLIEDSVQKTGKGVQLAQELSGKLKEIESSVRKVVDLMDEVAAASQEQASGANQVNTAMIQIDKVTQQNASIVEETAAASEELATQARELMNLISFFKIDEGDTFREVGQKGKTAIYDYQSERNASDIKHHTVKAGQKGEVKTFHAAHHELAGAAAGTRDESNGGFEEF